MEFSAFHLDVKSLTEAGQIEGLAAAYNNLDLQGDRINPGAFGAAAQEAAATGRMPAMLLHHDMKRPIGRWDSLTETPAGLVVKGKLTLGSNDGAEAYALLRDRALTGLSVGFSGAKSERGADGVRNIKTAVLHEVSIVSIPANPLARISAVKSVTTIRDLEELLHSAGLSGRKAKAGAAAAWRAITANDQTAADEAKLADILTQATASLSRFKGA
jgi:HK97 family phage prohead protease